MVYRTCRTMNRLKSAISSNAVEKLVLQLPHLTHDEDGWERLQLKKSGRRRIGAFLPDLFRWDTIVLGSLEFLCRERWYVWFCFASSSISMHSCSVQPNASCDSRLTWSLRNRPWISLKCSPWESTLLHHPFHAFQAIWYSLCSSVLPCRAPWVGPFFIT